MKRKSRVVTLGVACFFCAITALGVVPFATGGAGILSNNYAGLNNTTGATAASNAAAPAARAQSADSAQNLTLNLDPATDETIYTTDNGIEIKSHNVSATGTATSIQYFTLGAYNGTPVNWLIVGASSVGLHTDSTPAGTAVKTDSSKQTLVTGVVSSSLLENQILCVSEYAFNQETYTPNFVAHGNTNVTNLSSYNANYSISSDQATDYYSSFTEFPNDVLTKSLNLGTTLGLNGLYGGDIVKNTTFSSNYVFSLSSSHYTTFVGATNYKIPYLFTATSTATNVYSANMTHTKSVLSSITEKTYPEGTTLMGPAPPVGQGSVRAELNNLILSTGVSGKVTTANLTATCSKVLGDRPNYYFTTYYSATNYSNTLAYRPAFIMQL